MRDQYGRDICYLRISVTDRCNLRCVYCMPEEGVAWMPHGQILTYEQIVRVVEAASRLGVSHIRLTGGEPLVRPQLYRLVEMVKGVAGIESVGLTTNGVLLTAQLSQLRQAGLDGVNLSLDTLDPQQFAAITRRAGLLPQVLEGLEAAAGTPGLTVKVNCVPTQLNGDQVVPLARLAQQREISVRFIELMPIGLGQDRQGLTQKQVMEQLTDAFGAPMPCARPKGAGPGAYVTFPGFTGRVGFISALSHQFCHLCNRVRLTADGHLKTCLQYQDGVDLKPYLAEGVSPTALEDALEQAMYHKPAGHHFTTQPQAGDEKHNMNQIGG